jgi:hypothetical protein
VDTYIKNKVLDIDINRFDAAKGVPFFCALSVLLITPWDIKDIYALSTISVSLLIILVTLIFHIFKIDNTKFVSSLILIGLIEIFLYNYNLHTDSSQFTGKTATEFKNVRFSKYVNERIDIFQIEFFNMKPRKDKALYAVTGSYLQNDFGPALRQDLISPEFKRLMNTRANTINSVDKLDNYIDSSKEIAKKYDLSLLVGDPKNDNALRKVLGFKAKKIRLVNYVSIAKNERELVEQVTHNDIYKTPVIMVNYKNPKNINVISSNNINLSRSNKIKVLEFDSNKIKMLVKNNSNQSNWLIYADAINPNWKAYVDNKNVDIYPANIAFKSVIVKPGNHIVEFIFSRNIIAFKLFFTTMALIALFIIAMLLYYPNLSESKS